MSRLGRGLLGALASVALAAVFCSATADRIGAAEVRMKDGRILQGKAGAVAGLAEQPEAANPSGEGPLQLIQFFDDDLRRTFVSKRQVQEVHAEDPGQLEEKFTIPQRVPSNGRLVKSVGPVIRITPFDEYGRRTFTFNTLKGPIDVVQGITELTPRWARVKGITYIWDMRLATSSIPRDVLHKILWHLIDPQDVEDRKKIARFYLQSERYAEAREALEDLLKAFPDKPEIAEQIQPTIRALRQLGVRRLLKELQLRSKAGQHRLVLEKLQTFPSEDVAGEILQQVAKMIEDYKAEQALGQRILALLDGETAKIKDVAVRERIEPIRKEIAEELNLTTLGRLKPFLDNVADPQLLPDEKLSLAIGGWLLGSNAPQLEKLKFPVALSLYKVRDLVKQYINEPVKLNRERILADLGSEEGAQPEYVARLLAQMKPPVDSPLPAALPPAVVLPDAAQPEEAAPDTTAADAAANAPTPEPPTPDAVAANAGSPPGFYELEAPGLPGGPPFRYLVQLPPEYDAYRRYPAVITLHGSGTTAAQQVDWWAGAWTNAGWRAGQATRHGYIVIAPLWTAEHQKQYGYSAREHAAVLDCLRDACRRFGVDTDRVFLSGHSMGGDAAWDIGLAHPDLWAGVIPIVARSDRYCALYWENAKNLPFYVVCGELDGNKLADNARDLDRYLTRGYNCTVVEYLGRGHEHFYDEILRIFEWMDLFRRDFFPREFNCSTMREWDNFFWWIELAGLPPRSMVDPSQWPPPRGTQAVQVSASITTTNGLYVRTGSSQVTVWISPEMLDLGQRVTIVVNGRRMNSRDPFVQPNLETLLEDVRTRGDRQHPFWAKLESATGRLAGER